MLDFGSQYTHLISRRIRELHVYSEIVPSNISADELQTAKGIILSGSPATVFEKGSPLCDPKIFELGIPVLGLCYGHQLMAHLLGGKTEMGKIKEFGVSEALIHKKDVLFKGLSDSERVWMSHGVHVTSLPKVFTLTAKSKDGIIAAMADYERRLFGLQFHPEVTHTKNGMKILRNFVEDICKAKQDWTIHNFIEDISKDISEQAGDKKVFLLVSGGVDSTVCFSLLNKTLGKERVYGLHVDTGFMRKDESKDIQYFLRKEGFDNFHVIDAEKDFLEPLKEIYDPEEKRKIIGNKFIEVQQRELRRLDLNSDEWLLAQGTIYPDTIESSGTKHADLIKTHHNRVQLIQVMINRGMVIEPLQSLYKDEVRELGLALGLPEAMVLRHPYPGPGLAIRCLCSNGKSVFFDKEHIDQKLSQIIPNSKVLPIKSVGVQGDERSYKHPAFLISDKSWQELEIISTDITNKVHEINRVLLKIDKKKDGHCENRKAYLTKERLDLLRNIDTDVHQIMKKHRLEEEIWQFPVVLIPIGDEHFESVVLRPVGSTEAMTASFYHMEKNILGEIAEKISKYPIDHIFYDITNKPPATIEWE
ncbi:MAG: glutamine-hydrolyzing GMP synthase [Nanoarchaeota archaeon]|nr:glutamine-hydrolyzing GMP synthase [Nanoarchaeota archaeon]